jgi:hypothetical protein
MLGMKAQKAKPIRVKTINQCLTNNCEAVLQCYRDDYPVPDTLMDSFGKCLTNALQSRFPFEFWREEHPELAGIIDTETMGAKSAVYISDIDAGLFKLYYPIMWSIPRGTVSKSDKQHLNLNRSTCATLENVLNSHFPDTDSVVIAHPMSVDNMLSYTVYDFMDDNAATLRTRHSNGSWDFMPKLEDRLPTMYLESPADILIVVVYEAVLYAKGVVIHSLLEHFNPNNSVLKRDTDIIMQSSFTNLDTRISAYPQRWVTPSMLPWLTHIQGNAIRAAITKNQLFSGSEYITEATETDMQIIIQTKTADNVLSAPYHSGVQYKLQADTFFATFDAYCKILAGHRVFSGV